MKLRCLIGLHSFTGAGCACLYCGTVRHQWRGCRCHECRATRHERTSDCAPCKRCGEIGNANHTWKNNICEKCGAAMNPECAERGHYWLEGVLYAPDPERCILKCRRCGERQPHNFAGCKCSNYRCNTTIHDWNFGSCSRCGEIKSGCLREVLTHLPVCPDAEERIAQGKATQNYGGVGSTSTYEVLDHLTPQSIESHLPQAAGLELHSTHSRHDCVTCHVGSSGIVHTYEVYRLGASRYAIAITVHESS